MQSNRVLGVGLLLSLVAAIAIWQLGFATDPPVLPAPQDLTSPGVPAGPAAGTVEATGAGAVVPAAANAADGRIAVAANAVVDDSKPAVVGRVVGPDGQPIAGAKVVAAPGLSFANANGRFDLDSLDMSDLDGADLMDPTRMMKTVREQLADRVEATTNADGRFRVHAKGASKGVGLRVLARGHEILDRRVARPTDQDVDAGTLSLQKGAIVAGRVLDPNGNAIVGAHVGRVHEMEARMMGGMDIDMPEMGEVEALRGGEAATTDEKGRFELAHLTPGDVILRARHPDHPTAKSDVLPVELGRELRDVLLTMQRGGEIRGTVTGLPAEAKGLQVMAAKKPRTDAADPTGMMAMFGGDMADMLSEMGMSFGERTADIAADGTFVLRGLARETYRVWVGRNVMGFAGNGVCSQRLEAQPGANVELRFEPGISVTFTVVDQDTGAPVERLWVGDRLRGGGGMADMMAMGMPQQRRLANYPGGVVTVANVRPKPKQKLTLTIDAIGYAQLQREDLELPKSGNLDLGTLRLAPTPVLRVTVVDADAGRPVAGATVSLSTAGGRGGNPFGRMMRMGMEGGGPQRATTDREGRCTLNRFVDASGELEIDAKGFAPFASAAIAFTKEGPDTFTATLPVGGRVDVSVLGPDQAPIKEAVVEHRAPDGELASKKADAMGLVRLEHLAPGTHSFRLGKDAGPMGMIMAQARARGGEDEAATWTTVEVADKATATVRLLKQPTATLRGIVRENGLPLAGARVAFREGGGASEADMGMEVMGQMFEGLGGGKGRNGKADDSGVYTLTELPEGEHRLEITHKTRAMPTRVAVTLRNGDNTFDVELDMTTVRGVVKDPQGNVVDGARVKVKVVRPAEPGAEIPEGIGEAMEGMMPGMNLGGGTTIKTDGNGVFELRGVDPDVELLVQATAKGFAPVSTKVTAPRGTTVDAKVLQLGAAGKIRVSMQSNAPFAAVRATFVGDESVPPVMQVLRKGKVTLDGLRPGTWEVESMTDDRRNADTKQKRTVEVVAGQTVDVDM